MTPFLSISPTKKKNNTKFETISTIIELDEELTVYLFTETTLFQSMMKRHIYSPEDMQKNQQNPLITTKDPLRKRRKTKQNVQPEKQKKQHRRRLRRVVSELDQVAAVTEIQRYQATHVFYCWITDLDGVTTPRTFVNASKTNLFLGCWVGSQKFDRSVS